MSCSLYLVFEYMEHDLAGLVASPDIKFSETQVKCYMHQLLSGLEHCHNRHVLHRDIKGSNILLDNSGCILAELLAGKPIMPGRTEVEQLHKIYKLCGSPSDEYWKKSKLPNATLFKPREPYKRCIRETFKDFPTSSLPLIDTLLAIDPAERRTATDALRSELTREELNDEITTVLLLIVELKEQIMIKLYSLRMSYLSEEVRLLAAAKNDNILKFIGFSLEPAMTLVTEIMKGSSLQKHLWNIRPSTLDRKEALVMALQISRAMAYLHENGIIHRDLKPNNIFLSESKKNVKLGDFGLCS